MDKKYKAARMSERISVRLLEDDKKRLDKLIEKRDAEHDSDVIREVFHKGLDVIEEMYDES